MNSKPKKQTQAISQKYIKYACNNQSQQNNSHAKTTQTNPNQPKTSQKPCNADAKMPIKTQLAIQH